MNISTAQPVAPDPARITLVVSTGCHFCQDARDALDELGLEFRLEVTELDLRSPGGMELAQRHGAGMSPLVLLDAGLVSSGRLPRNKLRKLLMARTARGGGAVR